MIITRIIGGLGNQMFQYAAARALSLRLNDTLKIDTSAFVNYSLHSYGLNNLSIVENIAEPGEFNITHNKNSFLLKLGRAFKNNKEFTLFKENSLAFDAKINTLKGDIYLDGYWQSEYYFKDFEDVIRNDFKIITDPSDLNIQVLNKIKSTFSVSIHIRRGDYVNDKQTNAIHGVCSLEYYSKALTWIKTKLNDTNLHLFIFSDDPEWVEKNMTFDCALTYVKHNTAKNNYEDLRLMSACNHHIIANSSFSWWGAWLNPNPDKIVIAPQHWFKSTELDSKDIIPANWKRL